VGPVAPRCTLRPTIHGAACAARRLSRNTCGSPAVKYGGVSSPPCCASPLYTLILFYLCLNIPKYRAVPCHSAALHPFSDYPSRTLARRRENIPETDPYMFTVRGGCRGRGRHCRVILTPYVSLRTRKSAGCRLAVDAGRVIISLTTRNFACVLRAFSFPLAVQAPV